MCSSGIISFAKCSTTQKVWEPLVWAMVLPNGLTSFRILQRNFKSPAYIDLLSKSVVPIYKLNYGNNYWFQQDNSRIHTAKVVKEWMTKAHFQVME